ncbi:ribosome maturation factor RimP [Methylobacillus flagellatus]|uniref:ribosome maturation factor RimP n=1 Tax=Methylobacillus flagellatus TaxID=405 RepID=UPI0010F9496E|nr:ribosome maturation factor RimP [Methylobacillus flagellatus]
MQDLHTLLERSVSQLGFELVDMELSNRGKLIRLFVDKPEGITIDDCVLVSNHLSNLLAVETSVDYDRLEVSSPGIDRVLKKIDDFERFSGQRAQIKVRMAMQLPDAKEPRKKFLGLLRGVEQGDVLIECEEMQYRIAFSNIDKARLAPEF